MPDIALHGMPGVATGLSSAHKIVFRQLSETWLAGGREIDGTKARDPGNTGATGVLRPGTLLGKITASGKYGTSVVGVSQLALTGAGTTLTLTAAAAVELVRRVGATGNVRVTGPAGANGTARTLLVPYSAVDQATGALTITAAGVNQAEDVRLNPAATGGNLQLTVQKPDGTWVTTGNAAWSATDATFLANIQAALDAATGVVGGIVAGAIAATDTDLGVTLTYAGAGYAGLPWGSARVAVLPTSVTDWYVVPRTAAVQGAFVAGSLVGVDDGSYVPTTFVPDGTGIKVVDYAGAGVDEPFPRMPVAGVITPSQLIPWPSDTGLQNWIKQNLSTATFGKYVFDDAA